MLFIIHGLEKMMGKICDGKKNPQIFVLSTLSSLTDCQCAIIHMMLSVTEQTEIKSETWLVIQVLLQNNKYLILHQLLH